MRTWPPIGWPARRGRVMAAQEPLLLDVGGLELIGESQVCWGSDFPHSIAIGTDAQQEVGRVLGDLPAATRQRIAGKNAETLFRLN